MHTNNAHEKKPVLNLLPFVFNSRPLVVLCYLGESGTSALRARLHQICRKFSQKTLLIDDFVDKLNYLLPKMQKALALSAGLPVERQFNLP